MHRTLIIEDEKPAATHLQKLIKSLDADIEILDTIDSIEDSVAWLRNYKMPDLIFMDIQLADGLSFNIFDQTPITCPIIFTTAYDEYALKAFKVNSIDYLLKPIDQKDLIQAWNKFKSLIGIGNTDLKELIATIRNREQKTYRERFLVKKGDGFKYITTEEVAYFYAEDGLTFMKTDKGEKNIVDEKIEQLVSTLNPNQFYRINRKLIIHEKTVASIENYFNSRLLLKLTPSFSEEVIVARDRVSSFKLWLNQ